ncbi:MAG TPA: VanZ family protein [Gemmataceae bacterium]|jgi:VanZ family protein|nr:VanZ family protein [Gemmataceae bacterium]
MKQVDGQENRPWAAFRWLVWLVYAVAWTRALLMQVPVPGETIRRFHEDFFLFAKCVHLCAYALFAMLTGWLVVPARSRWLLLGLLVLHAAGTEYLQQFTADRHASVRDVGLNLVGLGLGVAMTWRLWSEA